MNSTILVTGGTGTLGKRLVMRLLAAGREVRTLSRTGRDAKDGVRRFSGYLASGEGGGGGRCAGSAKGDEDKARHSDAEDRWINCARNEPLIGGPASSLPLAGFDFYSQGVLDALSAGFTPNWRPGLRLGAGSPRTNRRKKELCE